MFNNYFFLSRAVFELNRILCGSTIKDIYTQEKNILFFHIPSEDLPYRHLIISANAQKPYLLLRDNHKKAKKNAAGFFEEHLPAEILNFQIAVNDRIIKITLDNSDIFFTVKGKNTNIYLTDDDNNEISFKKSRENILEVISNTLFNTGCDFDPEIDDSFGSITELKKHFPMISAEIKNELSLRKSNNPDKDYFEIFKGIIQDIFFNKIGIGFSTDLEKIIFAPNEFQLTKSSQNIELFDNYNSAVKFYLSRSHKEIREKNISAELEKYFDKELSRLSKKLNNLKARIEKGSSEEIYYKYANLLLGNMTKLKKGLSSIELSDYNSGENIEIKIDPKISPQENIDKYFEKAKDEKVNFKKSQQLFKLSKQKFDKMKSDYERFKNSGSGEEIKNIYDEVLPKREKQIKMNDGLKFKYYHYLLDGKYNIYVGRDSKSNDYLSVKFAKQNDFWFHARGMPGSHVVLKVENNKEAVPKNILKQAASIAAFHSKAKTAGTVPVSYTFAKFVYKKKGLEPGKVILSKENTILVKPAIPAGAELVNE